MVREGDAPAFDAPTAADGNAAREHFIGPESEGPLGFVLFYQEMDHSTLSAGALLAEEQRSNPQSGSSASEGRLPVGIISLGTAEEEWTTVVQDLESDMITRLAP